MLNCGKVTPVSVEVTFNPKDQTREKLNEVVDVVMRQFAVAECGIMGKFTFTLEGSSGRLQEMPPSAELKKLGVTSIKSTAA